MSEFDPIQNLGDREEVRAYFERLERECPQVVEALKVMNIPYRQYLAAVQAMKQPSSLSTASAKLSL